MKKRQTALIVVLFSVLCSVTIAFYLYTVDLIVSQTRRRGLDAIDQIRRALDREEGTVQEIILQLSQTIPAHIVIVDTDARLLADSHKAETQLSGKYIDADLSEARLRRGEATHALRNRHPDNLSVSIAKQVDIRDHEGVLISVTYDIDEIRRLEISFLIWMIITFLLLTAMIVLFLTIQIKRYRRPIRTLLQHTKDAAASGLSKISIDTVDPDLDELVENFNSLVDRYDFLVVNDNRKYSRINTLLSNLQTGILMIDRSNKITLVNPRAEMLLDLDKARLFASGDVFPSNNEHIAAILRQTRLIHGDHEARSLRLTSSRGEILECSLEAMTNKYLPYDYTGVLVLVRDVTEMKRLDRLKQQFVANVSHELRTPLTVISGFAETLGAWKGLSDDDRNSAVSIIALEAARLKKLIGELLTLSRFDDGVQEETFSPFDVSEIVREVRTALEPIERSKDISTMIHLPNHGPVMDGVKLWFRQIVYNIYDNALKYTPAGGWVEINVAESDRSLSLSVSDSGPGVPKEEREHIFERFYQINRSTNSKNPGSGLGLSIAKHMIDQLSGTILVSENREGGALFILRFPVRKAL